MKKVLYVITILIIIVGTGILMVKLNTKKEEINEEEPCYSITGGGFTISFNTNSDIKLGDINVCIACAPDTYEDLPIPERLGYTFGGWYYDEELTNKVEATNTLDITPQPIYKQENCISGYKNITLHAKWNKIN